MGMAVVKNEVVRPRYKGAVVCRNCSAEFNPNTKWYYGYYVDGTSGEFISIGKIPEKICPVCRRGVCNE